MSKQVGSVVEWLGAEFGDLGIIWQSTEAGNASKFNRRVTLVE